MRAAAYSSRTARSSSASSQRVDARPAPLRWLVWGVPAFVFFFAFLHRVAPGAVVKEIMQAFNASAEIVGLLSAMYFYAYAGFMIPAGLLIDRFGVRRVFTAGSVVMGLGSLLMGLAASRGGLMTGRFLVGVGATVTFIGCLKIAADWVPPSHFGTMSAVTATVGILGALGGTAPLAALVALASWRGAFMIIAVVTLAGAAACYAVVRDRPPGAPVISAPAQGLGAVLHGMMEVLVNRHTWPPFLVFFFFYAAWGNLMLWSIPFLHDIYGLTTTSAGAYASTVSFALLFSAPLTGYLSDRVLRRRKLPYTVLSACLFLFWTALALTAGALPLWGVAAVLFGMGAVGGAFVLTWPIAREVNPPSLAGTAVAVSNMGGFVGAALTQKYVGRVLDAGWTGVMAEGARVYPAAAYAGAFKVCALFVLIATGLTLLLRETRGRNIYHELYPER
jgi:MFS family permease